MYKRQGDHRARPVQSRRACGRLRRLGNLAVAIIAKHRLFEAFERLGASLMKGGKADTHPVVEVDFERLEEKRHVAEAVDVLVRLFGRHRLGSRGLDERPFEPHGRPRRRRLDGKRLSDMEERPRANGDLRFERVVAKRKRRIADAKDPVAFADAFSKGDAISVAFAQDVLDRVGEMALACPELEHVAFVDVDVGGKDDGAVARMQNADVYKRQPFGPGVSAGSR